MKIFRAHLRGGKPIVSGLQSHPQNRCEVENATVASLDPVIKGNNVSFGRSEVKNSALVKMVV